VPPPAELPARVAVVAHVLYLVFTEGHTATTGAGLTDVSLAAEAIRLTRRLHALVPRDPEVAGLLALMLLTDARRPARTTADGAMVRLADQDRSRWDPALIAEGHALVRACLRRNRPGPFQIQAAIAAVHADAATAEATDWAQIVALYDLLYEMRPNAVVALNRAVAVAELDGPGPGLAAVHALDASLLDDYQPYHATRADLLARAGHRDAARAAYDRAIALSTNVAERRFLEDRRAAVAAAEARNG